MNTVRKKIEAENRAAADWSAVELARLAQCYDHGCAAMRLSECSEAATRGRSEGFVEGVLASLVTVIAVGVGLMLTTEVAGR